MKIINGTILVAAVCALALCAVSEPALADDSQADVVVYGSSPAAVTAAVKAKGMGLEAVIVSPELHIGGLSVSGLGFEAGVQASMSYCINRTVSIS